MQQHFIERAAALPSKSRVAESRGLWPTLPAGAGRSPQLPCATRRKELSNCPVKPAKGESLQAAGRGPEEASGRRAVQKEKRALENRRESGAPEHTGEERAGAALQ